MMFARLQLVLWYLAHVDPAQCWGWTIETFQGWTAWICSEG